MEYKKHLAMRNGEIKSEIKKHNVIGIFKKKNKNNSTPNHNKQMQKLKTIKILTAA